LGPAMPTRARSVPTTEAGFAFILYMAVVFARQLGAILCEDVYSIRACLPKAGSWFADARLFDLRGRVRRGPRTLWLVPTPHANNNVNPGDATGPTAGAWRRNGRGLLDAAHTMMTRRKCPATRRQHYDRRVLERCRINDAQIKTDAPAPNNRFALLLLLFSCFLHDLFASRQAYKSRNVWLRFHLNWFVTRAHTHIWPCREPDTRHQRFRQTGTGGAVCVCRCFKSPNTRAARTETSPKPAYVSRQVSTACVYNPDCCNHRPALMDCSP
jgi:hypothetical protein